MLVAPSRFGDEARLLSPDPTGTSGDAVTLAAQPAANGAFHLSREAETASKKIGQHSCPISPNMTDCGRTGKMNAAFGRF
jgi:hypothetical protein